MLFLFLTHELFIITKTECQLDKEDCPPEIIQKLDKLIGSNVLFLNQKRLTKELVHSFLVEKVGVGFKVFNTLRVNLASGSPAIPTMVILVKDLPVISMDTAAGSTESANWPKPSGELEIYTQNASQSSFGIWDNGRMTPVATDESQVKFILSEKPDEETVKSLYQLMKMVNKYLNIESIIILGQRVFLSQTGQPDIIVSVPFDEGRVSEAIKSYSYLVTLKKDAKVIDLRFKNPIIR
ncbi:hypothetical protein AUJ42_00845 [Candidatus Collierbacteria bacterium CG1_02_44_10]|uniref:POTRA domain-containing protein n=4 Tax=Candidatus Collieribacteriota TaxID=1752725 RepID=A0A2H0DU93_9BACT|nr:MAG: hypothetical protein AUJ42_00845 [Candidatus Collierbacteria bacterium CG1_02_44_10]PIP85438.1 MAG: hypothetical protein COW83_04130 [Candidatus Collierbacteria bacterium CG22_combo_CG10-13_8_21_14_all_43_12]PIR99622.1 MAG: hypothetical protein COT86_03000 [Candidatus Collierbacteria bacterium CG10_big_fil_rev_8_21_14_0_10_43_36]PIZ24344.1 MAG: hypothetical protein COY48_03370 [Candidatus Collierbacteria bacterium CG_4_10_14_0_8_um_filter_43_86]PJB48188.1 MAG: hypothetical protein CO104